MSENPMTHCEHGIDRAYRCIDCIETERDALRAWAQELEAENLALQNVLSSQQRAPSLEKLVADLRRTELESLRTRVKDLEKTLNWHEKHSCSVCLGEPLRSGKRCVCRGVGTASGEAQGFREEMHALRASIVALADEWEGCALANEQCSYPDEARIKAYRYCATKLRKLGEGNGRD